MRRGHGFYVRLRLRAGQRFAAYAVDRLQNQAVLRADLRNGTIKDGGSSCPLALLSRNLWCEPGIWRLRHQAQCLLDALLRHDAKKRGLL